MTKTIIKRDEERAYTYIPNSLIQNNSLSAQARGLMAYFLSFPDNWMIYKAQLIKNSKEGRYSITSAMDELKKVGYLFCKKNGNRGRWQYYVSSKVTNKEELEDFFEKDRKFDELTDKEKYEYFMANQPISPDNIYFNSDLARKLRWKTLKNNIILK